MTHKEKILEFVDISGLNKAQFCKKCNLSNGYLDTKGSINTDKLASILKEFPSLNIRWLLFDEGEIEISKEDIDILNGNFNEEKLTEKQVLFVIESNYRHQKQLEKYEVYKGFLDRIRETAKAELFQEIAAKRLEIAKKK